MVSGFTAVTRRAGMPQNPVIATLDNRLAKEVLHHHFPDRELQTYPSIEACLEAVRQKKADVTYIRASSAQYQTMRGGYPDLVASGHLSPSSAFCRPASSSRSSRATASSPTSISTTSSRS